MSTFRNPVGPQPSRVYWRRRLIVGLGALAVILIVVLIVSQLNKPATTTPVATNPSNSSTPSDDPSGDPTAEAGGECDPAKITVDPITDLDSYEAGQNPMLSFTLKSTMTEPCTLSAGSDVQELRITSGEELIWSSKDCQTDPVAAIITLQPGVPKGSTPIPWDRTRSSVDTCDVPGDPVTAEGASYHLEVIVDGIESKTTKQFLLF